MENAKNSADASLFPLYFLLYFVTKINTFLFSHKKLKKAKYNHISDSKFDFIMEKFT